MTAPTSALALSDVHMTFGATRALRGVDLEVRRGEVHALVGQNGSGKSTLIKIMAGFHRPDTPVTGRAGGHEFALGSRAAAHDAGLRFVHQDLGVVLELDSVDNMALGHGYHTGLGGRVRWRRQAGETKEALGALGYAVDVRVPLERLAPVERTAVAIARALRDLDPGSSLLVLDEPTATMPSPEVERLLGMVRVLRDRGMSVLYVSHHLDEVYAVADRVTVLRDGRVVTTEAVRPLPRRRLVEHMVGDVPDEQPTTVRPPRPGVALTATGISARNLREFAVDVRAGEVVGVAGITGSGREELCDALFGRRRRTGTVTVGTTTVEPQRPDQMVAAGAALVPANRRSEALVLEMTVRENLNLPDVSRYWNRLAINARRERRDAAASLDRLGVKASGTEAGIDTLSGGNQQKVVVGRWLRLEPAVLLLDEPTQGVDVRAKADIHALVDEAAERGTAVLVCSTDEPELERLCHRVLVLRDGRTVAELAGTDLTARRIAHESLGTGPDDTPTSERALP